VAWALGGAVAGTTYTALFLALAALTRHAVVIGLLFVLLWEGLLGGLLSGIRWLAIGAWGQEIAASVSDAVTAPGTGLLYAVLAATILTLGSIWFAGDRLRSFTLRGDE
jgi:ABC-2 type transport system permease protein